MAMTLPSDVGQVYEDFTFIGPSGARKTLRLLVDTGSTFTWIHADILRDLGVPPSGRRRFTTIESREVPRPIGDVLVEYQGETRATVVVFATPQDAQVLGLHALEGLSLEVDPLNRRLKKSDAVLALAV